jgi:hypothetical protein
MECPRGDTYLTYMIDIALTTEFSLITGDERPVCVVTGAVGFRWWWIAGRLATWLFWLGGNGS